MHRQTKVQRASTRQETNTTLHTNSTNKRTQPTTWPIETTTQHTFTIGNTYLHTPPPNSLHALRCLTRLHRAKTTIQTQQHTHTRTNEQQRQPPRR